MTSFFKAVLFILGLGFTLSFCVIVIPPFLSNPDIIEAFAAGFVNPYSSGYSLDTIFCWMILAAWIFYEAKTKHIKYGWIAALIGVIPGVATGFAFYLFLRMKQNKD